MSSWPYMFNAERHSVVGHGAHVGTHASHDAYGTYQYPGQLRDVQWWNATESGAIRLLTASTPWWQRTVESSPFNMMRIDVQIARNAKAAAPHVGYHPFFCPKRSEASVDWHREGGDMIYGDSHLWQEHLLHIVVSTATREVGIWNSEYLSLIHI